jgi:hypothetical protein
MSIGSILKKGLLTLIFTSAIIKCDITEERKNIGNGIIPLKVKTSLNETSKSKKMNKMPWKNVAEYDSFVRHIVNENYLNDVKEIYKLYNIKREIPKYGFEPNDIQFSCYDCEGAFYKYENRIDSIYFYSTCSEDIFKEYSRYSEKMRENIEEELTERIHHYIKHEAGHAFYYDLGNKMGANYLFETHPKGLSILEEIQHSLIEEGVAEYISYKGELNEITKQFNDDYINKMIEEEDKQSRYNAGFILVKPILDINFDKGIKELIKNPLTKDDLNDLLGYRERIIKNLSK